MMRPSKHQFIDLCKPNCETQFISSIFEQLKSCLQKEKCKPLHFIRTDVFSSAPSLNDRTVLLLTGNEQHRKCTHFETPNTVAIFQAYPPLPKPWQSVQDGDKWLIPVLPKQEKWFHLPLGCTSVFEPIQSPDRPLDLFFSGQVNEQRIKALHELNTIHDWLSNFKVLVHAYQGFAFSGTAQNVLKPKAYARFMGKSKFALCIGGKSPETYRHYEAAASGCIVLSSPLPKIPLYEESPFIIVNQWHAKHIARILTPILNDKDLCMSLSMAHKVWHERWATAQAVANHIVQSLKSLGAIE